MLLVDTFGSADVDLAVIIKKLNIEKSCSRDLPVDYAEERSLIPTETARACDLVATMLRNDLLFRLMKWSCRSERPVGRWGSRFEGQVMPPAAGGNPPRPPGFFNHSNRNATNPTFASEAGGAVSRRVCWLPLCVSRLVWLVDGRIGRRVL